MRMNFSVPAVALIAGAALGYCFAPSAKNSGYSVGEAQNALKYGEIANAGEDASIKALRARIKELEKALAEKNSVANTPVEEKIAENDAPRQRPMNPREFMEQMKKEDPARYQQMTNHMAQFRQRRLERAKNRIDFLSSIDPSGMSEEAQANHARLQELIAAREEIEAKLHSEDISDEDREAAMKEMFETEREMHEASRAERENLIAETARELGYEGEDATAIVDTIKEIIRATDSHGFGPPRGPRR